MSVTTAPQGDGPVPKHWPVVGAVAGFIAGVGVIAAAFGLQQASLLVLGGILGAALYHAAFGFTGGWRRFIVTGHSRAIRAQLLMIALASLAMLPLVAGGSAFGQPLVGAAAPVGTSVLVGAFLFGLGMQLGGGCGSGTLFTVGSGNTRMLITLGFFIIGSVIATAHLPFWLQLPGIAPVALGDSLGTAPAVLVTLGALAALAGLVAWREKRRHGGVEALLDRRARPVSGDSRRLLHGPWPLVWGAVALAIGNTLTLLVAGHPWSITYGLGLWGAKIADTLGLGVAEWAFWQSSPHAEALQASVLADSVSVMNFGLILGAMAAAGLAGRFAPGRHISARSALAAALGGLLLGYGARLAFGCNIGALFSGIATGSLHGWLWLVAGFAGTYGGVKARPAFGLGNP